jgi:small-conductance mechanosensitive channel
MPKFFFSLVDFFNPATLPGAIVYLLVFLGLAFLASRLVHLAVRRGMKRAADPTGFGFIDQLLQVAIFILAVILYAQLVPPLRALGTAALAGVSIVSIVVGLAAQNTLSNLIAGFSILLYHPYRVGDRIQLNTPKGMVLARIEEILLGYTLLRDDEGNEIIVPNSVMASAIVIRVHKDKIRDGQEKNLDGQD